MIIAEKLQFLGKETPLAGSWPMSGNGCSESSHGVKAFVPVYKHGLLPEHTLR
jgi:hypothetical protein